MNKHKKINLFLMITAFVVVGWVWGPDWFFVDPYELDRWYQTLRSIA